MEDFIYLKASIAKEEKMDHPSFRYTTRVEKQYAYQYTILYINKRATTSEIGFYPLATASYNDNTGNYTNASMGIRIAGISYFNSWDYRVDYNMAYLNNNRSVKFTDIYLYIWASYAQGAGTTVVFYDYIKISDKVL